MKSVSPQNEKQAGFLSAIGAFSIWGVLPLYIGLTLPTTAVEVIAWRMVLSLLFCVVVVTLFRGGRGWREVAARFRDRRTVALFAVAGLFVAANWLLYVAAVGSGNALEGALGYFLNPLMSVVFALVFLRERLRPLQWVALGIAVAAVAVILVGYGSFPWFAVLISVTFAVYGLIKNRAGAVDALTGFTLETTLLLPVGILCFVCTIVWGGGITMGAVSVGHTIALCAAGVVTSLPLLLFASAARRLSLVELGLIQYLGPIIQFVIGVFVLHEAMPPERWVGFGLIWLALIVFSADAVRAARRARGAVEPGTATGEIDLV